MVDLDSLMQQTHYPRRNFLVVISNYLQLRNGSLEHAFALKTLVEKVLIKLAFALTLNDRFLNYLSQPLCPLVIFSRGWRSTQTIHQQMSFKYEMIIIFF